MPRSVVASATRWMARKYAPCRSETPCCFDVSHTSVTDPRSGNPLSRGRSARHVQYDLRMASALLVPRPTSFIATCHERGRVGPAKPAVGTAGWSGCPSAHHRRDDAVVALEDQVMDVGRRAGTQGGQLGRCLLLVEQVERPIADGSTLQ